MNKRLILMTENEENLSGLKLSIKDFKIICKRTFYDTDEEPEEIECYSLSWYTKNGEHVAHVDVDVTPAEDGYYWFGNGE